MIPNLLAHSDALSFMERLEEGRSQLVYLDMQWPDPLILNDPKRKEQYQSFVFKVLQQARRVLCDSGNLFLFSNPELNTDFHPLLRRVFDSEGYVAEFVTPRRMIGNGLSHHDSVILYRRSVNSVFNRGIIKRDKGEIERMFPYKDNRGRYRHSSLLTPGTGGNFSWRGYVPDNAGWRFSLSKLDELDKAGFIDSLHSIPRLKSYLKTEDSFRAVGTIWNDIKTRTYRIEDHSVTGQSVELLERIVLLGSNPGDIVVDPFCGSGSMLIAASNLERKFMACDHAATMIEISAERLAKAKVNFTSMKEEDLTKNPVQWNNYALIDPLEEDEVAEEILAGESAKVEFKESAIWNYTSGQRDGLLIQGILKSLAAFLNSEVGGSLFIGVRDNKDLVDLAKDFETANPQKRDEDGYSLFLNDKIKAECGGGIIGNYDIRFFSLNDKTICKVQIRPSSTPVFYQGDFYVRNNNHTIKLTNEDFYHYNQKRFRMR